jgi:hypothetical protein
MARYMEFPDLRSAREKSAEVMDRLSPMPRDRRTTQYWFLAREDPDTGASIIVVDDAKVLEAPEVAAVKEEGELPINLQDLLYSIEFRERAQVSTGRQSWTL